MKSCIKCNTLKPLTEYYKHKSMSDGHLSKCKECTKKDTAERHKKLVSTPEGLKAERARHREKYHRLNYREKHKPTPERKREIMDRYNKKYPEKRTAKGLCHNLKPLVPGNELHHWCYKVEFAKDVIELSVADHNIAHREMTYDQYVYLYRDNSGNLLDTREKHISYLKSLGINTVE